MVLLLCGEICSGVSQMKRYGAWPESGRGATLFRYPSFMSTRSGAPYSLVVYSQRLFVVSGSATIPSPSPTANQSCSVILPEALLDGPVQFSWSCNPAYTLYGSCMSALTV